MLLVCARVHGIVRKTKVFMCYGVDSGGKDRKNRDLRSFQSISIQLREAGKANMTSIPEHMEIRVIQNRKCYPDLLH